MAYGHFTRRRVSDPLGFLGGTRPQRQKSESPRQPSQAVRRGACSRRNLPNGIGRMSPAANANTDTDAAAWHAVPADKVVKRLATNGERGLDAAEASTRLQKHGPNRLPEGKKRGPFTRFLAQFNNILVYVLLGAGFTKLMLNLWVDAAIIFAVVVLNALLGFIQEGKAEKALDSIRNMLSAE